MADEKEKPNSPIPIMGPIKNEKEITEPIISRNAGFHWDPLVLLGVSEDLDDNHSHNDPMSIPENKQA